MLPLISTVAALLARPVLLDQIPSRDSNQTQSTRPVNTITNTTTSAAAAAAATTSATITTTTVTVLETAVARAREIPHSMVYSPQPARVLALAPTSPSQISQSNLTSISQTNSNNSNSNSDLTPINTVNSNPPEFILAFARRNVPIDRVLAAAGACNMPYVPINTYYQHIPYYYHQCLYQSILLIQLIDIIVS